MVAKLARFFKEDIWRLRKRTLQGVRGFALRMLRIFVISVREFASDKCSLRASALTFFSLLSIVPVFAMAFGLAKGFGLDKLLKARVIENMEGQQEIVTRVIEFSENLLLNTRGGLVAGVGLLFLFWTVIKVLSNIEESFNDIWGVKKQRSWGRKFTDYLSLMLIAPVAFVVASSATVFIMSQIEMLTARFTILGMFGPVILTSIKFLPYMVFWGLLTYLYMFMPNTKIRFKSALLGGIVAGTVYQLTQWAYIHFQVGAAKAGAVYGSFAALPLFLMWLQISWLIVLFGAELAFAHQNEQTFEFEPDCLNASYEIRKLLSLRVTQVCVRRFADGLPPLSADEIALHLEIPVRLTRDLLFRLTGAGLLTIVSDAESDRDRRYQPARDLGEITVQFVIEKLEKSGSRNIPSAETPELKKLKAALDSFDQAVKQLPENALLKDLSPIPSGTEVRV